MEVGLIAVITVVVLIGGSILGTRIGVAAPLVLVLTGIGIGFLPFVPEINIDPEIILLGVLPPLLYAAAVNVPLIDFRRNFRPIVGLSVILVILTTLAVGFGVHWLVPQIPLPVAFALGAVISPTDAVAATSIGKRLGMPPRVVDILEGESLVNDATSLVLLKTALAALAGSFSFWPAAGTFSFAVIAAVLIGLAMGIVTVWLRAHLRNPVYDTLISFAVPFIAFIPAEYIGASGVIAVVTTGLYTGHHAGKRFSATARFTERLNWRTVQFTLENGVFLLMGLELHSLIDRVNEASFHLEHVAIIGFALVGLLILCRGLFMFPMMRLMHGAIRHYAARKAHITSREARLRHAGKLDDAGQQLWDRRKQRTDADIAHAQEHQLGWRDGVVLSWSGMRGVVTLAAAQSIPESVPFRDQVVLIAFVVATVTLLLHGLTLPPLIRKLWPGGIHSGADTELHALCKDLIRVANEAIDEAVSGENGSGGSHTPEAVVERARASARSALNPLMMTMQATGVIETVHQETPAEAYLRLSNASLSAQRAALLEAQAVGRYRSSVLVVVGEALDAHENRLTPP